VIVFNSLGKEEIYKIIDIVLSSVFSRLETLGYSIELTTAAKDFLSEKGYDPQFGARPLHRAIQKYVEDPLAEEILNSNVNEGDTIVADLDTEAKDKLKFEIKKKSKSKKAKEEQN
jgi:ATP-dependent Clp protease ATP-binding subunit ClpC